MIVQRFIEITAKSLEEARQLAEKELKEGEVITDYVILQAPAKGIFGIIGSPETRVRFTCKKLLNENQQTSVDISSYTPNYQIKALDSNTKSNNNLISSTSLTQNESNSSQNENFESFDYGNIEDLTCSSTTQSNLSYSKISSSSEREYSSSSTLQNQVTQERNQQSIVSSRQHEKENIDNEPNTSVTTSPAYDLTKDPAWNHIENLILKTANTLGIKEIQLRTFYKNGYNYIEASGSNLSALIGKNGKTIDALQYLTNIILNKDKAEKVKVILDVQGYRERRQKSLISLANRLYKRVINTGKPIELKPMSTIDRRTIHLALKNKEGVETFSKGIEPRRRVIISPTKQIIERVKQRMKKRVAHNQSTSVSISSNSSQSTTKQSQVKKLPHRATKLHTKTASNNSRTISQKNNKPPSTSVPMFLEGEGTDDS